ncbi:histone-lysine N-methyltransferase, H3 lysine-4 specific [Plasmodium gaboni]|uniref:Histone-lysine N-methyltransferase, H3 lysine-4 specific n=1 Tax=Plasmodium gaboni TaxID=647221 RepID=A0A151LGC8_9APIC|nr:histone-lysine N-methyltransferase, H3 lysine-4 specific [Plasmodium gaboni]KYN98014.1 histone-lysine N-methyltransferase, H3 lysine-4 specific [Plasmodium gaboni]
MSISPLKYESKILSNLANMLKLSEKSDDEILSEINEGNENKVFEIDDDVKQVVDLNKINCTCEESKKKIEECDKKKFVYNYNIETYRVDFFLDICNALSRSNYKPYLSEEGKKEIVNGLRVRRNSNLYKYVSFFLSKERMNKERMDDGKKVENIYHCFKCLKSVLHICIDDDDDSNNNNNNKMKTTMYLKNNNSITEQIENKIENDILNEENSSLEKVNHRKGVISVSKYKSELTSITRMSNEKIMQTILEHTKDMGIKKDTAKNIRSRNDNKNDDGHDDHHSSNNINSNLNNNSNNNNIIKKSKTYESVKVRNNYYYNDDNDYDNHIYENENVIDNNNNIEPEKRNIPKRTVVHKKSSVQRKTNVTNKKRLSQNKSITRNSYKKNDRINSTCDVRASKIKDTIYEKKKRNVRRSFEVNANRRKRNTRQKGGFSDEEGMKMNDDNKIDDNAQNNNNIDDNTQNNNNIEDNTQINNNIEDNTQNNNNINDNTQNNNIEDNTQNNNSINDNTQNNNNINDNTQNNNKNDDNNLKDNITNNILDDNGVPKEVDNNCQNDINVHNKESCKNDIYSSIQINNTFNNTMINSTSVEEENNIRNEQNVISNVISDTNIYPYNLSNVNNMKDPNFNNNPEKEYIKDKDLCDLPNDNITSNGDNIKNKEIYKMDYANKALLSNNTNEKDYDYNESDNASYSTDDSKYVKYLKRKKKLQEQGKIIIDLNLFHGNSVKTTNKRDKEEKLQEKLRMKQIKKLLDEKQMVICKIEDIAKKRNKKYVKAQVLSKDSKIERAYFSHKMKKFYNSKSSYFGCGWSSNKKEWTPFIHAPFFENQHNAIYKNRNKKLYEEIYDTLLHGRIHPDIKVVELKDHKHPIRLCTPYNEDCYSVVYTGKKINATDDRVIFGEYTGYVANNKELSQEKHQYMFALAFNKKVFNDRKHVVFINEVELDEEQNYPSQVGSTVMNKVKAHEKNNINNTNIYNSPHILNGNNNINSNTTEETMSNRKIDKIKPVSNVVMTDYNNINSYINKCKTNENNKKSRDINNLIILPDNYTYAVDSSYMFNEMSLVNHYKTCSVFNNFDFRINSEWQLVYLDGWPHIILTSIPGVEIHPGEEIFADFGFEWFEKVNDICLNEFIKNNYFYRLYKLNTSREIVFNGMDDIVEKYNLLKNHITCNICMHNVNTDGNNFILCSGCNHVYHLKCVHKFNTEVNENYEWFCSGCLQFCFNIIKQKEFVDYIEKENQKRFIQLLDDLNGDNLNTVNNEKKSNAVDSINNSNSTDNIDNSNSIDNINNSNSTDNINNSNSTDNINNSNSTDNINNSNSIDNIHNSNSIDNIDNKDNLDNPNNSNISFGVNNSNISYSTNNSNISYGVNNSNISYGVNNSNISYGVNNSNISYSANNSNISCSANNSNNIDKTNNGNSLDNADNINDVNKINKSNEIVIKDVNNNNFFSVENNDKQKYLEGLENIRKLLQCKENIDDLFKNKEYVNSFLEKIDDEMNVFENKRSEDESVKLDDLKHIFENSFELHLLIDYKKKLEDLLDSTEKVDSFLNDRNVLNTMKIRKRTLAFLMENKKYIDNFIQMNEEKNYTKINDCEKNKKEEDINENTTCRQVEKLEDRIIQNNHNNQLTNPEYCSTLKGEEDKSVSLIDNKSMYERVDNHSICNEINSCISSTYEKTLYNKSNNIIRNLKEMKKYEKECQNNNNYSNMYCSYMMKLSKKILGFPLIKDFSKGLSTLEPSLPLNDHLKKLSVCTNCYSKHHDLAKAIICRVTKMHFEANYNDYLTDEDLFKTSSEFIQSVIRELANTVKEYRKKELNRVYLQHATENDSMILDRVNKDMNLELNYNNVTPTRTSIHNGSCTKTNKEYNESFYKIMSPSFNNDTVEKSNIITQENNHILNNQIVHLAEEQVGNCEYQNKEVIDCGTKEHMNEKINDHSIEEKCHDDCYSKDMHILYKNTFLPREEIDNCSIEKMKDQHEENDILKDLRKDTLNDTLNDMSKDMSKDMSNDMSKDMSNDMSNDVSNDVSNDLDDKKNDLKSYEKPCKLNNFIPLIGVELGKTKFQREFTNGTFVGTVTEQIKDENNNNFFVVTYEDGDVEWITPSFLFQEILKQSTNNTTYPLASTFKDIFYEDFKKDIKLNNHSYELKIEKKKRKSMFEYVPNNNVTKRQRHAYEENLLKKKNTNQEVNTSRRSLSKVKNVEFNDSLRKTRKRTMSTG